MRRLVLSLAPAALALVALMACEDDTNLGGSNLNVDSGTNDFDASTAFDGSVPDSGTDATPDADVPPAVTVTVTTAAGPEADVLVVFNAADGSVIETKKTGADGRAVHAGSDAKVVTAIISHDTTNRLVTWTGVEVGDNLQLLDPDGAPEPTFLGNYDFSLATFEDAGANSYFVRGPCNSASAEGTTASFAVYSACAKAKNSVLGRALIDNEQTVGFGFTKGINAPAGGNASAVTLGAWAAPKTFSLQLTNLPSETWAYPTLAQIADGMGFWSEYDDRDDQGSTVNFKVANGFADAYQSEISRYGNKGMQTIMKHVAGTASSIAFDYEGFLPEITGLSLDATNARRPVLSWTSAASLAGADGAVLSFRFWGPQEAYYEWRVIVPPGATSVTIPALPPEAEAFAPPDGGTDQQPNYFDTQIAFLDSDAVPSYALFRQLEGALPGLIDSSLGEFSFPIVPVDGTYRTTSWQQMPRLRKEQPRPVPVTE